MIPNYIKSKILVGYKIDIHRVTFSRHSLTSLTSVLSQVISLSFFWVTKPNKKV